MFERAVAIDPDYAGAWADLSFALYWRSASGGSVAEQSGEHDYLPEFLAAAQAADRALDLEPNLPEALHARSAIVCILDWNQTEAIRLLRLAVKLAPNDAQILHGAAIVIGNSGFIDEALALAHRAIKIDPISLSNYATAASLEAAAGDDAAAEANYRIACEMSAHDAFFPRFGLFILLLHQQRYDECRIMIQAWSLPMHRTLPTAMLEWAQGDRAQSDANLNEIKRLAAALACYQIAQIHAFRGEADATFEWLDKCIAVRDPGVFNAKTDRLFRFLHVDARWMPLMRKLGFDD